MAMSCLTWQSPNLVSRLRSFEKHLSSISFNVMAHLDYVKTYAYNFKFNLLLIQSHPVSSEATGKAIICFINQYI